MELLESLDADVIVLTEGCADLLPSGGFVLDAGPDWGYRVDNPNRRKVLVWSKNPWTDIDVHGDEGLPSGRFVEGTTVTPIGSVRIIGVCVPWRGAHVTHGHRNRQPWEDHGHFLRGLAPVLAAAGPNTVVVGDFNQRIPRANQPIEMANLLDAALVGFEVPTAQVRDLQLIDHIAHACGLEMVGQPEMIAGTVDGLELSDHTGVSIELVERPHP